MNLEFNINIPNEPYTDDVSEGKTITAEYRGSPYIVIGVADDNRVVSVDRESDEEVDLSEFVDDELTFHLIAVDASNVLAVSYLTHAYTNPESEYSEAITADETYTYPYDENNALADVYNSATNMTYDSSTGNFTMPEYATHNLSSDNFWTSISERKEEWKVIQSSGTLSEDQQTAVDAYVTWMENAPTTYAGVAHWKIQMPASPEV